MEILVAGDIRRVKHQMVFRFFQSISYGVEDVGLNIAMD